MSEQPIEIKRWKSGEYVTASLCSGLSPEDFLDAEEAWHPHRIETYRRLFRERVPQNKFPQSLHWSWANKSRHLQFVAYEGYGIRFDNDWQGLLLVSTAGHVAQIGADRLKPLVYVDFIETAPWNQPEMAGTPRFRGVGVRLMEAAVRLSIEEGFHGRVGLVALPQAELFYVNTCGMTRVGPDKDHQQLIHFEMTREQAKRFLE
jgi:hypothetical protein